MPTNRSISPDDDFADFVDGKLRSGRDGTASELVCAGLRLLEERQAALLALREAIGAGERSGPAVAADFDAFLDGRRRGAGV
jgi:antitoxin ParD1/3/4